MRTYRRRSFWWVGIIFGLFSGLIVFLFQLLLFHLSTNTFSPVYLIIYLIPFIAMSMASRRLREHYGEGVLGFGQGFRLSVLTGFVSATIMSVMVYFIYSELFEAALLLRASQLHASLVSENPGMDFNLMKQRKDLISKLLSPVSLAIYYFIIQIVLAPVLAFFIAIFAMRRRRDITDI